MMAPEPLRSAMTSLTPDDTSLAVPSDNKLRSGQQRVLDQVHTIKRSKSKHGAKNGTLSPSPTSMSPTASYEFGMFKFSPSKANGTFSSGRFSSTMTGYSKGVNTQKSRTLSTKSMGGRNFSSSGTWEQQISAATWPKSPNGLKPSRSDPQLAPPRFPAPTSGTIMRGKTTTVQNQQTFQSRVNRQSTYSMTNGSQMTNSQTRMIRPSSSQSQVDGKTATFKGSKIEQKSGVTSGVSVSDLTVKEAVEYLSHPEESFQQCGATFIQHITFKEEDTKKEVKRLGGIPPLVALLESDNPGVCQFAVGALRNLVFKDQANKLEVQNCSGISKALRLLKETDSTETQKQITGLLWNLSSADALKEELLMTALPALTEHVVVPFNSWSDISASNNIHPDVFYNATGCLRNLSYTKTGRQRMRDCSGLIDSLMSYVQSSVAEENPDDKSVENCTCILHNLTYELENENPESFTRFQPRASESPKNPVIGCFSPRSNKAQNEFSYGVDPCQVVEESNPTGVKWLCHTKAMQTYLSLLGSAHNEGTLEASCGALQNLTAGRGLGSHAMSQILTQKLGALLHISPHLKSPNQKLQKTAMCLLDNMSRVSSLHSTIAKEMLPELASLLRSDPPQKMGNCDETIAAACNTMRTLMLSNSETSKKFLDDELVSQLANLSENGHRSFPKGSKAASLLLYSIWNDNNLQSAAKKLGISKSRFVNADTIQAHKLAQSSD